MRLTCAISTLLASLGCDMPRDVEGTFDRVRGGVIRAGVTECRPWTVVDDRNYGGVEVTLLKELAGRLDARVEWHSGSETELFEKLHHGELDVVIGGVASSTPWSDYIGLSQWYARAPDKASGKMQEHVWAVPPGENRWLLVIDKFLQQRRGEASRLLDEASE